MIDIINLGIFGNLAHFSHFLAKCIEPHLENYQVETLY